MQFLNGAEASLAVEFPDLDWAFLQSVYGWSALQYQGWARGYIDINANSQQGCLLYTDDVLEFWVDEVHYFGGDFFGYRKAPPLLHLAPGRHRIDIRLIRDVRAMGGFGEPKLSIKLRIEGTKGGLAIASDGLLISDVVNERLASPLASVPVRNDSTDAIEILSIVSQVVCPITTIARGSANHDWRQT